MTRWLTTGIGTGCLALAACVTINVYFPAAAAEKAADRIIEDIWGQEKAAPPAGNEQSSVSQPQQGMMVAALQGVLDFVVPVAHAQADIDVSSPPIRALTASMKARAGDLEPFFTSGAIGLTSDGLVEVRDANSVALADRNRLRKLVSDDNADRNSLYREIATANNHPEWEADIRSTFAERWIANARAGWYYKKGSGAWTQK
ncbi:MAG TPA: YdbL family protein [Steroidobacteraceae bacterium]|nr:YdbL family protein [Steroidobacteraceae bacterium]